MKFEKIYRFLIPTALVLLIILFVILETSGAFTSDNKKAINIEKGSSFNSIVSNLYENDAINSRFVFRIYSKLFFGKELNKINAGEIVIEGKMSYKKLMDVLTSTERTRDDIALTIPEGFELREIADVLEEKGLIERSKFYDVIKNYDFDYPYIKELEKTDTRLEGFLFPDTYMFSKTLDNEVTIVKKMLARFDEIFKKYENKTSFSTYEIITLASIIEREAANKEDFLKVSSVFHNRLKRNDELSYLQSCATVQYILKERKKVLTFADTKIDSPYNTYKYPGLPKGPIASPGESAINAALNPASTGYYYFLNDKNGSLHFSKTLSEHNSKVNKYVN